jgi:DNA recombination protein RmuC
VQENTNFHTRLRDTQVQLNEQQKQNIEKLIKMKEQRAELKKEFEQLSINVFGGHPKGFSRLSQNNLSTMIKPLESQIDDFKGHIETLYKNNSKDEMILNQEILSLKELNRQISQDTINLINTLKGGENWHTLWSEMILQKVLEYSGLRKGIHYTMKVSLKNNNNMYRPDVLVHLPNKCDLIIDAKSSLNAYEKFISEDKDSNLKEAHLEEHIKSIRSHIKALSNKNYEQLLGINTLDFIFLFIPIEGALTIALERDKSLYDDAFKNHILLVSSTTLLIAMRAIENIWKDEKENQNAREIVNKAELLYGKFVKFSNDMIKISKQFDKLQTSFESSKKQLNSKKIDVVSRFEQKIT